MTLKTEDTIFFVFDNDRVKDESDFIEDGILYFSPSTIQKSEQSGLAGQLIGVSRFLKSTFGSPASVYCLRDRKVAFRHINQYTLGLSGRLYSSSSLLLELLDKLIGIFWFYQGGFGVLQKVCESQGRDFDAELQKTWDCFIAFIKRYGDTMSSDFQSVPFLKVPKKIALETHLQSAHLIQEACDLVPGAKAGCLFYDNQVCFSQMDLEMTLRFIVVRPKQQNLPCQQLPAGLELQGVRLFKVYLTSAEFQSLNAPNLFNSSSKLAQDRTSYSAVPNGRTNQRADSNRTLSQHLTTNGLVSSGTEASAEIQCRRVCDGLCDGQRTAISGNSSGSCCSCEKFRMENSESRNNDGLLEMEMFVQGSSDSVCVLLMESGSLSDITTLKKVWRHILMGMSQIETLIRGTSSKEQRSSERRSSSDCHYLIFNNATGCLNGNLLHPMTSLEHNFCQSAQMMHAEFRALTDVREITLRTHQAAFAGVQDGYDEFFVCSKGASTKPSKEDLETKQLIAKLKAKKLNSL